MTNTVTITVNADMLRAALICASTEQARYYINGVYVDPKGYLVSTDGHRMFCGKIDLNAQGPDRDQPVAPDSFEGWIIPSDAIKRALTGYKQQTIDIAPDRLRCPDAYQNATHRRRARMVRRNRNLTRPERGAIRAEAGASANTEGANDMTDSKYNGWTNYETWRVNLEMFDGYDGASDNDLDAYDLGQNLRDTALETIGGEATGLALDYAEAFLANVNWYEIAQHMIENYRANADAKEEA